MNIGSASSQTDKSQGVLDPLLLHDLVITNQTGQDGKARRVCRCPARRAKLVRVEIEDGAGIGPPALAFSTRADHLVELPIVAIHHDYMPIAAGFHGSIQRNR